MHDSQWKTRRLQATNNVSLGKPLPDAVIETVKTCHSTSGLSTTSEIKARWQLEVLCSHMIIHTIDILDTCSHTESHQCDCVSWLDIAAITFGSFSTWLYLQLASKSELITTLQVTDQSMAFPWECNFSSSVLQVGQDTLWKPALLQQGMILIDHPNCLTILSININEESRANFADLSLAQLPGLQECSVETGSCIRSSGSTSLTKLELSLHQKQNFRVLEIDGLRNLLSLKLEICKPLSSHVRNLDSSKFKRLPSSSFLCSGLPAHSKETALLIHLLRLVESQDCNMASEAQYRCLFKPANCCDLSHKHDCKLR